MITLPRTGTRTRFVWVTIGAVIVFWMGMEDHQAVTPALLGWLLASNTITSAILRRVGGQVLPARSFFVVMILWGGLVGACASIFSAILMFLKTGWHGHVVPDYSLDTILGMFALLPIWSVAGVFFGIAVALTINLLKPERNTKGN